jgi:CRISPR-associated protein Csy2
MHSSENALLVLPRIKVQNANCISAPLTWGFPSVTSFAGLMTAIERRLGPGAGIHFTRFGVVCHDFQPQVNKGRYLTTFNLTRNPVGDQGETLAIVEEGRAHMEVSLIFAIQYDEDKYLDETAEQNLANAVQEELYGQRIAGGSVLPPGGNRPRHSRPKLIRLASEGREKEWRRALLGLLPGYSLVMRNDLLGDQKEQDGVEGPLAKLNRFIRMSGRTIRPIVVEDTSQTTSQEPEASKVDWAVVPKKGWIVPIPVGYSAIGKLHSPGSVANARDRTVPFRFVETVYSMGQWVSPHRIRHHDDMLWRAEKPTDAGLYVCRNLYPVPSETSIN